MSIFVLASAAESGAAKPAFPPFDPWHFPSQLFWLVLLFGFLYIVLSRLILPRLGAILERRENTIAESLDEAVILNEQSQKAQAAVETSISAARTKARETAAKARLKIDVEIREETAVVDANLEKKLAEAEERITALRADAIKNVESFAVDAGVLMAKKIGAKVKKSEISAAVKPLVS